MMLTEKQAQRKWCPMSRPTEGAPETCIASQCMAWRWAKAPILNHDYFVSIETVAQVTGDPMPDESQFEAYMTARINHPAVVAYFNNAHGGAPLGPIQYDAEEVGLFASATFADDPTATGYCGLAGRLPGAPD